MSSCAILCVDDEAIILLSLKEELRLHFGSRFRYETACNAKEAMSIIDELADEKVNVILIISDWLMPGMKGDEFLIQVKKKHPDIQSILVTGHADAASIERALKEASTSRVLTKPWGTTELIEAVKHCVDISQGNNASGVHL